LALESLGKEAHVFNADPHSRPYHFLPGIEKIQVTDRIDGKYDGLFMLECGDLERPGLKGLDQYLIINIDHHHKTEPFGTLNWVDPTAAAAGEMIYQLAHELKVAITPEAATNLYVALFTDTGSFQYSNTTAQTLLIAGDLVRLGADPAAIARSVHMTQPITRIQLLGLLLKSLQVHTSGKIASISLTQEMLSETGAAMNDTEGVVDYPLSIDGVEIAAFLREESNGRCRISLRSKNLYDVSSVAELFGGGGHKNAAGLVIEKDLKEAHTIVTGELEKLLNHGTPKPENSG